MLYITGDCHGDFTRFKKANFPEQEKMTKEDYVIICGDFGYHMPEEGFEKELAKLSLRGFTTLFIDGNHENFDKLCACPMSTWHGGLVHIIAPSVMHLIRGEYYENVGGHSIFTFGGAHSGDFEERTKHVDWWEEEEASDEETEDALDNLEMHGNRADIVITHECPYDMLEVYSKGNYEKSRTSDVLSKIKERLQDNYDFWFFGHHHHDMEITKKDIMVFKKIIKID